MSQEQIDPAFKYTDDRIGEISERFDALEEQVGQIDQDLSVMAFGEQITAFSTELKKLRTDVGNLESKVISGFLNLRRNIQREHIVLHFNNLIMQLSISSHPDTSTISSYLQRTALSAVYEIKESSNPESIVNGYNKRWREYLEGKGLKFFVEW